ncbi:methionine-gamma-lyase [Natronospira proteinivora]|uniref:L-methionine gamma-lyase n=1 Tax=Natronospira proteinivora TaxID=1807133 RepID=A0ABT1GAT9_9GAMM|nr:methionine gamma-lyase [Natronospira proteinivora]MCP1727428.1 methionine-gamma-lyase [Natronospira proteinivora]
MAADKHSGFATRAIHYGYEPSEEQGALTPPMHITSTFAFDSAEQGAARFAGEEAGHFYSRISNPTVELLEKRMAALEGAEAALGFASGMGAITALMWSILRPGDELITDTTLYGCTHAFFNHGLAEFGIKVTHVDLSDPANLEAAISDKTKVVYFETPANPTMDLVDIEAVAKIAKRHGACVAVDNTYATPVNTRPIELGADFVVHSATKYLGGHGDLVAGILLGSEEDMFNIRLTGLKDFTGAVMSPFTAFLLMRGLKTLEVRMERQSRTAMDIARWLEAQPHVQRVYYPGLESFPQHALAKKQMADFSAIMAFDIKGGVEAGRTLMNSLTMIRRAVSLGDAESLIQHPASMTHSVLSPEERAEHGISDDLVRLSVGLETPADIIADLQQAFAQLDDKEELRKAG